MSIWWKIFGLLVLVTLNSCLFLKSYEYCEVRIVNNRLALLPASNLNVQIDYFDPGELLTDDALYEFPELGGGGMTEYKSIKCVVLQSTPDSTEPWIANRAKLILLKTPTEEVSLFSSEPRSTYGESNLPGYPFFKDGKFTIEISDSGISIIED